MKTKRNSGYHKRDARGKAAALIILLALILFSAVTGIKLDVLFPDGGEQSAVVPASIPDTPTGNLSVGDGMLQVSFIDVGQADCILAQFGEHAMLIDAGNNGDGPLVAAYLQSKGISFLDYVICTHAHEDHCGGIDNVIGSLEVANIILPLTASETKSYQSVLQAAESSPAVKITPQVGDRYALGDASFLILSCDTGKEDNLNESSIVLKLSCGNIDFMLTGDAERVNEEAMMNSGYDVSAEILKAGHHGSLTSNSVEWLWSVAPEVIVVSVGADNDYNLPNEKVLSRFQDTGAQLYRTDELGTIIIRTDGTDYTVETEQTATNAA